MYQRGEPSAQNGLQTVSQIMVDKISTIQVEKARQKIGHLTEEQIETLNNALRLWLYL